MGKSIVILGADFSKVRAVIDLTSEFTFVQNKVLQIPVQGGNPGLIIDSLAAAISNYIDVSQYRGKKIVFSGISWQSSGGVRTPWGAMFFTQSKVDLTETNTDYVESPFTWYKDSGTPSDGELVEYEMIIPPTANYFRCDWFNSTNAESRNAEFYCYIAL